MRIVARPLFNAWLRRDWTYLSGYVAGRWGLELDENSLADICLNNHAAWYRRRTMELEPRWSDGTFGMWLQNRLQQRGLLATTIGRDQLSADMITATLHVGFLCIEETPLMVSRLRNEPVEAESNIPRTKLTGSTSTFVAPIDRTALAVAPVEEFE